MKVWQLQRQPRPRQQGEAVELQTVQDQDPNGQQEDGVQGDQEEVPAGQGHSISPGADQQRRRQHGSGPEPQLQE